MPERESTTHLTEAEVAALLDPGIEAGERAAIERASSAAVHAASCAVCGAVVSAAQQDDMVVGGALRLLDHRVPAGVNAASLAERLKPAVNRVRPGSATLGAASAQMRQRAALLLRSGALIAVAAAAAAAAVAPRSPLHHAIVRLFSASSPPASSVTLGTGPEPGPAPEGSTAAAARGVAVAAGRQMDVVFRASGNDSFLRIVRGDGGSLSIRSDVAGPAFVVARDSVLVDAGNSRGVTYEVVVPRDAPMVRVRVGNRVVFDQRDSRITAGVTPDASGAYSIPLGQR